MYSEVRVQPEPDTAGVYRQNVYRTDAVCDYSKKG